jgi:signal transduction histidine kinase
MASLGQLTAGIAHEINNPINFVSANIQPLKDDLRDILELVGVYEKAIKEHLPEKEAAELQQLRGKYKNGHDFAGSE